MSEKSIARAAMAGEHATERQRVIRQFRLTPEELSRPSITRPGDPICLYAGDFALQAGMIAEERPAVDHQDVESALPPGMTEEGVLPEYLRALRLEQTPQKPERDDYPPESYAD